MSGENGGRRVRGYDRKKPGAAEPASPALPCCDRCQYPISAGEPYAVLECSQRELADDEDAFDGYSVAVLLAWEMVTLCGTCGEHLRLTSSDVPGDEKLCRVAALIPEAQAALADLPSLPAFEWLALLQEAFDSSEECRFCKCSFIAHEPWVELSLTYGCSTVLPGVQDYAFNVLDEYVTAGMCEWCCTKMPLPLFHDKKEDDFLTYRWVAAFVRLLGGS